LAENGNNQTDRQSKVASAQGIRDIIERTFLAGMGAAALTKDRIQELVEELVSRGQLNATEGREVVDRLMSRSREEARTVLKKADSSLHSAYRELGLGSKREMEELSVRVQQLEHRIQLLESQIDAGASSKK
jgi:polyhydroxyalkanoate synthesis regulator phasin